MNNIKLLLLLIIIIFSGNVFAMGGNESAPADKQIEIAQVPPAEQPVLMTRAEQVMRALALAYPRQIERVEFKNNDWAVLLRGTWYYYTGGRLLPENLLADSASYSPHGFYNYLHDLPAWKAPSKEEQDRLSAMSDSRSQRAIRRSQHFFDSLWRASNRNEAYDRVKSMRFLGKSVTVHFMIMEELALVEEAILTAAKTDKSVQTWINGINKIDCWGWRNIADTETRSYHSYGLAIDIVPKSYGGKETYWLWTQDKRKDWWNVPYSSRYHPPAAVIKAFEKYGFIWGGKWVLYDTMHFEYRPEILILAGIPPENSR